MTCSINTPTLTLPDILSEVEPVMAEAVITEEQFNAAAERVIVAIDVPTTQEAFNLIDALPKVRFLKFGFEAMTANSVHRAVERANTQGKRVFWDGKWLDIKNTVLGAFRALPDEVAFCNLHAFVGRGTMQAVAVEAVGRNVHPLAVTILTDKTHEDLVDAGLAQTRKQLPSEHIARAEQADMEILVLRLARLAHKSGMHGVVCSPQELPMLREEFPKDFLLVTPGIRPIWAAANDQKRITTPTDAGREGADYIVVGRPITTPPEGLSPADAFDRVVEEFAAGVNARRP